MSEKQLLDRSSDAPMKRHMGLKASRTHRAFGGFSMGGATTWCAFEHHLDIIRSVLVICLRLPPGNYGKQEKKQYCNPDTHAGK